SKRCLSANLRVILTDLALCCCSKWLASRPTALLSVQRAANRRRTLWCTSLQQHELVATEHRSSSGSALRAIISVRGHHKQRLRYIQLGRHVSRGHRLHAPGLWLQHAF